MSPSVALPPEPASSPSTGVARHPVPDWVEWLDVSLPAPEESAPPVSVLLLDWQHFTPEAVVFHRSVRQLNTSAALDENAQVEIVYSPSRESLVVHHVLVYRDGAQVEHAQPARFRFYQRETNLERHTYDDRVTAALHLEDLRPGDVVDISYSLGEPAPRLGAHVALWQDCDWGFPVAQFHFSVTAPAEIRLLHRSSVRVLAPSASAADGYQRLSWTRKEVAATVHEEGTPPWFPQQNWVQVSTFPSWGHLATFLCQRWGPARPAESELAAKIEEIKRTTASPEDRVLLALRSIQNDVRTSRVPFGCGGLEPADPSEVFARRFGDSRDKASLLCTMLAGCGVAAAPAVTSIRHRDNLSRLLPAPDVFDHVIVRVRTEGGFAWVDPTVPDQRGNLRFRALPDYRTALVVTPETMDLTTIDHSARSRERADVGERFILALRSFEPSVLVTTRATGRQADALRHQVRVLGLAEAAKARAAHYARLYPGAHHASEPQLHEEQHGESVIVLTEQLMLPEFGTLTADGQAVKFSCVAHAVARNLVEPPGKTRTTPLAIPFPAKVTHQIEIEAPGARDVPASARTVETEHFRFSMAVSTTLKGARLQFAYEALTDHILPEKLRAYGEAVAEVIEALTFELTIPLLRGFPLRQKLASPLGEEASPLAPVPPKSMLANRKSGLVAPLLRKPHQDDAYLRGIDELIGPDEAGHGGIGQRGEPAPAAGAGQVGGHAASPDATEAATRAPALREGSNVVMAASEDDVRRRWSRSDHRFSAINFFGVLGAIAVAAVLVAAFAGWFNPKEPTLEIGVSNPALLTDTRFVEAVKLTADGDPAAALGIFDALGTEFPDDADLIVARGVAQFELGAVDEAAKCADSVRERYSSHPGALTLQGRVLLATGRADEARSLLESSLLIEPNQVRALRALGDLYFEGGDLEQAEAKLSALLKKVPDDIPAITKLATLHDRLGNAFTAREVFTRARSTSPANVDLALAYARFLSSHGEHHAAIHEAEAALALKPGRKDTLAAIADLYRAAGDNANARVFDERAAHAKP
jgi:Flp pilus assembly protein TadD/transglutaminase-like putative cysteine protease